MAYARKRTSAKERRLHEWAASDRRPTTAVLRTEQQTGSGARGIESAFRRA